MPRRPMTVEDLWSLPRVGAPAPAPDGKTFIVPVTTYSLDTNRGTTQLWQVPATARGAGDGAKNDPAIALTHADNSSGGVAWSPDGSRIAFLRKPGGAKGDGGAAAPKRGLSSPGPKHADQAQLYVMPVGGGEAQRMTDLPLGAVDPKWFPDGRRIAFLSPVYAEALTLEATAERAKQNQDDPMTARVTEDRFYRFWDHWLTDGKVHHIFVLDTETGDVTDLTPKWKAPWDPMDPSGQYDISPDGKEIVFGAVKSKPPHDPLLMGIFTVRVPSKPGERPGKIEAITPRHKADTTSPIYSPDGKWIVYGMQREFDFYADKVRIAVRHRTTKKEVVLTETWDASASEFRFASDKTLCIVAEVEARSAIYVIDLARAIVNPGKIVPRELVRGGTFAGVRPAGKRLFSTVSHVDRPPEIVSYDLQGKAEIHHTAFTKPVMDGVLTCETEEITFKGAEGDDVQMFLLYPPGVKRPAKGRKPSRRYPLVHMIHGGPHGVFGDQWHWRWCAQVFASPGYAVALVNFHGSTSWGQQFTASILGRWGDQPYRDIEAATDALIERGVADPKKLAVSGGSYGGYLVSWIASQTDRYACIVNHAGVCDFQTQYASDVTQGRRRSMGGEPWDDIEGMDRWNPMRHASGFKSPMLVIHGEKDYRVPYNQALEIYNVYKAMKLPARLVVYPNENHWILTPRNNRHWYGEVLGWFKRHLGTTKAASKAKRSS